jgi:hypothetical protein
VADAIIGGYLHVDLTGKELDKTAKVEVGCLAERS